MSDQPDDKELPTAGDTITPLGDGAFHAATVTEEVPEDDDFIHDGVKYDKDGNEKPPEEEPDPPPALDVIFADAPDALRPAVEPACARCPLAAWLITTDPEGASDHGLLECFCRLKHREQYISTSPKRFVIVCSAREAALKQAEEDALAPDPQLNSNLRNNVDTELKP